MTHPRAWHMVALNQCQALSQLLCSVSSWPMALVHPLSPGWWCGAWALEAEWRQLVGESG